MKVKLWKVIILLYAGFQTLATHTLEDVNNKYLIPQTENFKYILGRQEC
jgi:hypothetical protein